MLERKNISPHIRFKGAINIDSLSDQQIGPTCGFEALENIIELCQPAYRGRDLVRADLIGRAHGYNAVDRAGALMVQCYQRILYDYQIVAYWYPFDHQQVLLPALSNNQGVLVIGDAHYLNPEAYRINPSLHAFVLTNYYTDGTGQVIQGYTGVDSNFSFQQRPEQFVQGQNYWTSEAIAQAAQATAPLYRGLSVLVTAGRIGWPLTARFYRRIGDGVLQPVL